MGLCGPNTRKKEIRAIRRMEMTERGDREKRPAVKLHLYRDTVRELITVP